MRRLTLEEYLEAIGELEERVGRVRTVSLAGRLQVRPSSVTEMLGKLRDLGYVEYRPRRGAVLTPRGREIAGQLSRRHRTLSELLTFIGVPPEVAEGEACRIEHHVSTGTVQRMERWLEGIRGKGEDAPGESGEGRSAGAVRRGQRRQR
jgi:DtxR family Mn-dependent transcriptional regulator